MNEWRAQDIDLIHLFPTPTSMASLQHMLGGCSDEILILDGLPSIERVVFNDNSQGDVNSMKNKHPKQSTGKRLPFQIGRWGDRTVSS